MNWASEGVMSGVGGLRRLLVSFQASGTVDDVIEKYEEPYILRKQPC